MSRAPLWAWFVMIVGAVVLVVGTPLAANLGVLSADEVARAQAESDARMPTVETPSAPVVEPVAVARTGDEPLRVLITGDSLTNGLYASEQERGYAFLLLDRLGESGPVEETRAAVSGAAAGTVADVTEVPVDLDLAVVELGTNDVGRTDLAEFTRQYRDLLGRIRAASPAAALMCLGVWQDPGGSGPDYDAVISAACGESGGRFVALSQLFADEALRGPEGRPVFGGTSDDFHPNDAGYAAIADLAWGQLAVTPSS